MYVCVCGFVCVCVRAYTCECVNVVRGSVVWVQCGRVSHMPQLCHSGVSVSSEPQSKPSPAQTPRAGRGRAQRQEDGRDGGRIGRGVEGVCVWEDRGVE